MGPKCEECKEQILPTNPVVEQIFSSGEYDDASGFLCDPCHKGQREQYQTGPDWYDRQQTGQKR